MLKNWIRFGVCSLFGVGTVAPIWTAVSPSAVMAQAAPITPQQKAMLRRAAQVSAYRALAEKIYGLQVTGDTCVADLAKENDRVGAQLEATIRGVRLAEPRYYSDGTAEVDAEVTIEQIVTCLKHSYDDVKDSNGTHRREQIDEISKHTERSVISATGYASVHGNVQIDGGILPPLKPGGGRDENLNLPPIWVKAGGEERLKARRMAEIDAYRHLSERMNGVLVQGVSNGENFLLKNDTVRAATQSFVRGARISSIVYGEDGICTVTMQVTIQQLVEHLQHALDMVDRNGYNKERNELTAIESHIERKVIVETGTGALNVNPQPDAPRGGVVVP